MIALLLCSCSYDENRAAEEGTDRAAVLQGTVSGPEEDGIVHLYSDFGGGSRRCSGILVAKNLLVTAQHCVSKYTDGSFACTADGQLSSGSSAGELGVLVDPAGVEVRVGTEVNVDDPPNALGTRIFAPQTTTICSNDIAAVVLDREIEGISLYPVRLTRSVEPGEALHVAGYGLTEDPTVVDVRHIRRNDVLVARVGDNEFRPDGEAIAPRTFATDGPSLCPGDSGGPALSEGGALVGIFSLVVGGQCDSPRVRNVFTQTSPFGADILLPAYEAAEATPITEPGGGAGGSAGSEGSAGDAGEGGAIEMAGSAGTGGASSAGTGGVPAAAGSGVAGSEPARRGLRQQGGCRCGVPGGDRGLRDAAHVTIAGALIAAALRRRRSGPAGG